MTTITPIVGIELHRLIAEKVLGWKQDPVDPTADDYTHNAGYWRDSKGEHVGYAGDNLPAFGIDLSAAWLVVGAMLTRDVPPDGYTFMLNAPGNRTTDTGWYHFDGWYAYFQASTEGMPLVTAEGEAQEKLPALAICYAALAAIGSE